MAVETEFLRDLNRALAFLDVCRRQRYEQLSRALEIAVGRERGQFVDVLQTDLCEPFCFDMTEVRDGQRMGVIDAGTDNASVASASAISRDTLLQHDDFSRR